MESAEVNSYHAGNPSYTNRWLSAGHCCLEQGETVLCVHSPNAAPTSGLAYHIVCNAAALRRAWCEIVAVNKRRQSRALVRPALTDIVLSVVRLRWKSNVPCQFDSSRASESIFDSELYSMCGLNSR